MRLSNNTTLGFVSAITFGKWSSSTSKTAYGAWFISAFATPQLRLEPVVFEATFPSDEMIWASDLVVEVFPFVPETRATAFSAAKTSIELGKSPRAILPEMVSPDLPKKILEALPARRAIVSATARRVLFIRTNHRDGYAEYGASGRD